MKRSLTALASLALMATAAAQSASKPLNLKLSPADLPASSSSAGGVAGGVAPTSITPVTTTRTQAAATANGGANANGSKVATSNAPGVYYGDTSGRLGNTAQTDGSGRDCDDSTYNQAQVHGSVTTGVFSGSHIGTGTFGGGEVNVSKAFGSCDDPHGGISFSVRGSQTNFNGHRHGSGY